MKNCLNFANVRCAAIVAFLIGTAGIASAQAPQEAAGPRYVVTANGDRIPLTSGVEKHAGKVIYLNGQTIIDNRVDSNAILNLDAHPLNENATAAATNDVSTAQPARDINAELNEAKGRYAAGNADLKAAQKAKDKTRAAEARHDIAAAKSDIDRLNKEIAAQAAKDQAK